MISILMPCWITGQDLLNLTENAYESLKDSAPVGSRFVIVDNASTVGVGYLRSIADTLITNKTNLGYVKAVNQALKITPDEFLVIVNNDVRVSPNWWEVAKEIFKDGSVGSVHYRMTPYDAPFAEGHSTFITGKERWCTSSFFVIRWEALPDVLYDENYGLGGYDDVDFWLRVRDDRWRTAYTTRASYQHLDSSTQLKLDQGEREKDNERKREYFKSKWGNYPDEELLKRYPEQMILPWKSEFEKL